MSSPRSFYSSQSQPILHPTLPDHSATSNHSAPMDLPYWSQDQAVKDWLQSSAPVRQHDISTGHNAQSQSDHQEGGQVPRLLQSFHELCMQKHVDPHYTIESYHGGFRGILRLGEHHVSVDGPLQNKRAVREQLAAKGMTVVKSLATQSASPMEEDADAVNWVGNLQGSYTLETVSKLAPGKSPTYTYTTGTNGAFRCAVQLPISYLQPPGIFPSPNEYPNKKAAKFAAAQVAFEALTAASLVSRKQELNLPGIPTSLPERARSPEPKYCERLIAFTHRYGYPPPQYKLTADESSGQPLYSGSLYFPGTSLAGPLGRVESIFGRKNAKEELARQVLPEVERKMKERLDKALMSP